MIQHNKNNFLFWRTELCSSSLNRIVGACVEIYQRHHHTLMEISHACRCLSVLCNPFCSFFTTHKRRRQNASDNIVMHYDCRDNSSAKENLYFNFKGVRDERYSFHKELLWHFKFYLRVCHSCPDGLHLNGRFTATTWTPTILETANTPFFMDHSRLACAR